MTDRDEIYMKKALELAQIAAEQGEVPVGAIVVKKSHAELLAIAEACRKRGSRRLTDCTIYVTLEPCPMCAGAMINSRVERVVFGAYDAKAGSCGSVIDLFELPYNHKPELVGGVLEKECADILSDFFKKLRQTKKTQD